MDPAPAGTEEAVLSIASSETDSNLYYATRFLAGDPFIYIEKGAERIILATELELGRARREARVDRVVSIRPYDEKYREGGGSPRLTDIAELFLREVGVRKLTVPASFPLGHAEALRSKGFVVEHREDPFYPERAVKSPEEIERISDAQAAAEEAMALAVDLISRSEIEGGWLRWKGEPLTSEVVRREIQRFFLDRCYLSAEVIVAGGDQACDPHQRGSGPLPAQRPIIIDLFPRSLETRYFGDMTRTVVRGKASDPVKKLYRDVEEAQALAISHLRDGAEGDEIHKAVMEFFASRGNETGEVEGRMQGFFHGTGHGLGLDIHEPPRISKVKCTLKAGNVVTVEPGLYYPGIGGVRLEDVLAIEEKGSRNLNRFPKVLEI